MLLFKECCLFTILQILVWICRENKKFFFTSDSDFVEYVLHFYYSFPLPVILSFLILDEGTLCFARKLWWHYMYTNSWLLRHINENYHTVLSINKHVTMIVVGFKSFITHTRKSYLLSLGYQFRGLSTYLFIIMLLIASWWAF